MKKDLKTLLGLLLGAILGYFIVQILSGSDDTSIRNVIGVMAGMIITYAAIIGVKKAVKNAEQE